jgi:hypothetical protein
MAPYIQKTKLAKLLMLIGLIMFCGSLIAASRHGDMSCNGGERLARIKTRPGVARSRPSGGLRGSALGLEQMAAPSFGTFTLTGHSTTRSSMLTSTAIITARCFSRRTTWPCQL